MKRFGPRYLFRPFMLAVWQLDDPTFGWVVMRSIGWSLACFLALHFAALVVIHRLLAGYSALTWIAEAFGSIAVWLLTLWLFLPIAVVIGTLYFDRIALCVERRFYPWLPRLIMPHFGSKHGMALWLR
jgi:CysZ protein